VGAAVGAAVVGAAVGAPAIIMANRCNHLPFAVVTVTFSLRRVPRSRPFLLRRSRSRSRATIQLSVPRDVLERDHHVFDLASQSA